MVGIYKDKPVSDLASYSRPKKSTYRNDRGEMVVSPPNTMAVEYDSNGIRLGIKFGDGGTLTIPATISRAWNDSTVGTLYVVGGCPEDVVLLRWGETVIYGNGAVTTYRIDLTAAQAASNGFSIDIFPDAPTGLDNCHFLLCKYYNSKLAIPEEYEAMEELKNFVHGEWI